MGKAKRNELPTDEDLRAGSSYFVYHLRMYIETLLWLQNHEQPEEWNTERNSVLESHLIHQRVLIEFFTRDSTRKSGDILAIHYFHGMPEAFKPLSDFLSNVSNVLKKQAENIGGQLVHITTKAAPRLKSQQEWPIREPLERLVTATRIFLQNVPSSKFPDHHKEQCQKMLENVPDQDIISDKAAPST